MTILEPESHKQDLQEGLVKCLRIPSVQTLVRLEVVPFIEEQVLELLTWPENVLDGLLPRLEDLTIRHCHAAQDGLAASLIQSRWSAEPEPDRNQAMLRRVVFEFDEPHRHSKDIAEFRLLKSLGLDLK
ncbi:hypothetical protein H0H92_010578, partial [Tricholoma furcatifolium]